MTVLPQRISPTTGNYGPKIGDADYADRMNANMEWLAGLAAETLTSVAGTNNLTASCGTPPLTAYTRKLYIVDRPPNANTGPMDLNIDGVGSKPWKTQAGAAFVGGEVNPACTYLVYDAGTEFRMLFTIPTGNLNALPAKHISGFNTAINASDTVNDIDIAAGYARDEANSVNIIGAAMTKRLDATWAAGTGNGAILQSGNLPGTVAVVAAGNTVTGTGTNFTADYGVGHVIQTAGGQARRITIIGSNTSMTVESNWGASESGVTYKRGGKAKNTVYRLFAIYKDADGSVDYAAHSLSTPTDLPAGYSKYRRIWHVLTDASNVNVSYVQDGDHCLLPTPIQDYSAALSSNGATTLTSAAPPGVLASFLVSGKGTSYPTSAHIFKLWVRALSQIAQAGLPLCNSFTVTTAASDFIPSGDFGGVVNIRLNAASQYAIDYERTPPTGGPTANMAVLIYLNGWLDTRGRLS